MNRIRALFKASSLVSSATLSASKSIVQHDVATLVGKMLGSSTHPFSTSVVSHTKPALPSLTRRWIHSFASQAHSTKTFPSRPLGLAGSRLITPQCRRLFATTIASSSIPSHSLLGSAAFTAGLSPGTRKALAWWLGGCSAWVFSMVVLGGVTRLTRSGLSMTDWKFTGESPPKTPEEWEAEFSRYKRSPEYKRINSTMTVDEFKYIYWMEWAHRMWGRGLGLAFAIPAAFFAVRGAINRPLAKRLGLLFAMGGTQGFVGWWMVRSGLEEPEDSNAVPRVSPYRLAAHLVSAFAIYAGLAWTTMSVALPSPPTATLAGSASARAVTALRAVALPAAVVLAVTAVSGAFVAGMDAGHAYNTFPDMNGQWIPDEYWKRDDWRNAFESTAAVQLHHRLLALTTLATITGLWRYGKGMKELPRSSRLLLDGLMVGVTAQVALGISALLTYVPVELGAAHQAGALSLFTLMLGLLYSVRAGPTLAPFRLLRAKYGTGAAAAAVLGIGGVVANSA